MPKADPLAKALAGRELVYPKYGGTVYCVDPDDVQEGFPWAGGPLDGDVAGELFGWTTDKEEAAELDLGEPLGRDPLGNLFWGKNNPRNRPLYMKGEKSVDSIKQEVFNLRWVYNSEPIILGQHGIVLNGQHTLVALKFARIEYDMEGGLDWKRNWPDSYPYVEKLVTYGVKEDDRVVNTMDTCKPRSLSDVIFRCEYFPHKSISEGRTLAKVLESSVRFVWSRTGSGMSAFATHRTHSEAIDWIERHRRLLKGIGCVVKAYKKGEPGWQVSNRRLGAGYASGLMYLMALSNSDEAQVEKYREAVREGTGSDRHLDTSLWDKAEEFWAMFGRGDATLRAAYEEIGAMADPQSGVGGSTSAKVCVLLNAWDRWLSGRPITPAAVRPKFERNEKTLLTEQVSYPRLKGIDLGDPSDPANRAGGLEDDDDVEQRKEEERMKKEADGQQQRDKETKPKKGVKKTTKDDPAPSPAGSSSPATSRPGPSAGKKDRRGHTIPAINFNDLEDGEGAE
jgi:hypothetical protein